MKKLKQNNGITLIALVITIIVMLILAAVSITMAVNGGLFNYAKQASEETINAREQEQTLGSGIVGGKTIDQWVTGGNTPTINNDGFYYDTPYSATLLGNTKFSFVFKDTGIIEVYQNGIPDLDYWGMEYEVVNDKIRVNGVDCSISAAGKTVTLPGAIMNVMTEGAITSDTNYTTTFEEYHDIYYDVIYYNTVGNGGDSIMLKSDGGYLVSWINLPIHLYGPYPIDSSGHILTRWQYKFSIYGWKRYLFGKWNADND